MRTLEQVFDIKAALAIAGTSQAEIARSNGWSDALVSAVVRGKAVSAPVQNAINEAVGRDVFSVPSGNAVERGSREGTG